jgi:hypothetical protein
MTQLMLMPLLVRARLSLLFPSSSSIFKCDPVMADYDNSLVSSDLFPAPLFLDSIGLSLVCRSNY